MSAVRPPTHDFPIGDAYSRGSRRAPDGSAAVRGRRGTAGAERNSVPPPSVPIPYRATASLRWGSTQPGRGPWQVYPSG